MNFSPWYKAYADDLVFIIHHSRLTDLLNSIFKISDVMNLKVNAAKSNIMPIKGHLKLKQIDNSHLY